MSIIWWFIWYFGLWFFFIFLNFKFKSY